jgi:hypothetical protein
VVRESLVGIEFKIANTAEKNRVFLVGSRMLGISVKVIQFSLNVRVPTTRVSMPCWTTVAAGG